MSVDPCDPIESPAGDGADTVAAAPGPGGADTPTVPDQIRHELMTPLNQIIGYAELLIDEAVDLEQDSLVPDLQRIRNAGNTLTLIIRDFLGVSPGEAESSFAAGRSDGARAAVTGVEFLKQGGAAPGGQSRLLVVDDHPANREVITRRLERQGHVVAVAEDGLEALRKIREEPFDLILLDVLMPGMDGYQLLRLLKEDPALRHIPVIMISALGELDSVVRCISLGAEDYLPKPFNPVLLRARIGACLEKKRLRDMERAYLQQIVAEQEKVDRLLLNVLPRPIAERLRNNETPIADRFDAATVLIADIAGFTLMASRMPPDELIGHLNAVFSEFDYLVGLHGLEKIKTIGDAYMAVGGVPLFQADHAERAAEVACAMMRETPRIAAERGLDLELRIGLHTGPLVAGVIGSSKFAYDLWGDTVNVAFRISALGEVGRIHVSEEVKNQLGTRYRFVTRGALDIKGRGPMETAFLIPDAEPDPM